MRTSFPNNWPAVNIAFYDAMEKIPELTINEVAFMYLLYRDGRQTQGLPPEVLLVSMVDPSELPEDVREHIRAPEVGLDPEIIPPSGKPVWDGEIDTSADGAPGDGINYDDDGNPMDEEVGDLPEKKTPKKPTRGGSRR